MTSHIEARSLASLNLLAGNPPQYPTNPTGAPHEPLVLYISRVPGSRDVILSTFRPHRKNVTGEDVANSLYYIHVDNPSDLWLVAPGQIHDPASPRSSQESLRSVNQIPRKPLPANAKIPALKTPADAPSDVGRVGGAAKGPPDVSPEQPSNPPELPPRPPRYSPPLPPVPPVIRKPLGPRPMSSHRPTAEREASPSRTLATSRPLSQGARVPNNDSTARLTLSPTPADGHSPSSSKLMRQHSPSSPSPFALTLIRRDPVSGNQWNVGRITSNRIQQSPEQNTLQSPIDDEYVPQPAIHLHIDTPGYAKFRGMPSYQDVNFYRQKGGNTSSTSLHSGLTSTDDREGGFARNVVMAYTKSWTAGLRQRFQRAESPSSLSRERGQDIFQSRPAATSAPAPAKHHRQDSSNSMGSVDSAASSHEAGSPAPPLTQPGAGLKPRGYVFLSPWNGRCEFRTGNAGRSLKCRHIVDRPSSRVNQAYNPLVSSPQKQGNRNPLAGFSMEGGEDHHEKAPVSELRFNLPSGDLFSKSPIDDGKDDSRERSDGRHRRHFHDQFNRMMKLDHSGRDDEDDSSDDEGHGGILNFLDLTGLGREKAGGGNRGKRAKLGKLIIHDEGIKMLDLVVAANMGVWWSVWERSF